MIEVLPFVKACMHGNHGEMAPPGIFASAKGDHFVGDFYVLLRRNFRKSKLWQIINDAQTLFLKMVNQIVKNFQRL